MADCEIGSTVRNLSATPKLNCLTDSPANRRPAETGLPAVARSPTRKPVGRMFWLELRLDQQGCLP